MNCCMGTADWSVAGRTTIYAFLGIAPALTDAGIVSNDILPAAEIYQQFVRTMIAKTGILDILNCTRE